MGKQSGGGARTGFGIGRNAEGGQMGFAANISQRDHIANATPNHVGVATRCPYRAID